MPKVSEGDVSNCVVKKECFRHGEAVLLLTGVATQTATEVCSTEVRNATYMFSIIMF